jgi:hypothetical protein
MKFLGKTIENSQGFDTTAQVAMNINVQLFAERQDPNVVFAQPAQVIIRSWKSKDTLNAMKDASKGAIIVDVPDVSQLPSYATLVQEVIGLLLADPRFTDATIEDTAE